METQTQHIEVPSTTPPNPLAEQARQQFADAFTLLISTIIPVAGTAIVLLVKNILKENGKMIANIQKKLDGDNESSLLPKSDMKRIEDILAQIAIICDSDRVTLGVFHNGVIGTSKVDFDKVAIISGYTSPGVMPLEELGRDVPAANLMGDLELLWNQEGTEDLLLRKDHASPKCRLYFTRRDIGTLYNVKLSLGNIEMGVISIHWCGCAPEYPLPPEGSRGERKMKELQLEVLSIIQATRDREKILGS